ncbi:TonB-dependent receptor domain-containing protein [Brevundimonas lenta]|uniref:Outer membrane receptor protein involved in Fe transport n=1 Tax=Brevundimonas lenta TaxID=424796 RepID=A0A7W6JCC2_9CAUL|nr:TonB-dependent receptor [Brevundimonas lenta]MBB4082421.1 outer membrane receptor protein involved in Fe transport [Brevundimonas lenta]
MSKERLLTSTIVAGLAAFGAVTFVPTAVLAQDGQDEADQDATEIEEVVVVGSRIRRDTYNSPSPIQVITRDEATLAGLASTTEILQGTAITGGSAQINNLFGGFVVDGGPGVNTVSLRGLGPTRTLVLLNGRRVAPAGSRGSVGSADLNVLPSALIERVEVLRDGASSIYGSDAVAGVINIVTRNNLEGLIIEGQYNATTDAAGEGDQSRISIAGGLNGDRWHVLGSAEYYNREELTLGARDWARCPTQGFTDGTDYIDPMTGKSKCFSLDNGGVTINTLGTATVAGQGALGGSATFNRWRPNSAVTTGLTGFEGVGGGNSGYGTSVRDTFDPRVLNNSLFSPVEVSTLYLAGGYDLGALGDAEIYAESLFNRRESSQVGFRQLTLDYAQGSPLVPANIAALAPMSGNQGLNPGRNVQARAFIGFGNYDSTQEVDFFKNLVGIRGDFFLQNWEYDAYVSYTTSESTYTSEQFLTDRLIKSLDVVAAPGGTPSYLVRNGLTCRANVGNPAEMCITAPALNNATIGGDLPADFVNYVFRPVTGITKYNELVFSGGLSGPLFTLPAGEVQAYIGAEYREAEIDDTPGLDSQNGNTYNFSTAAITRGSDSVVEVFGEVEVPLLANMPFAQELTLTASGRYTDYESYGDDTTYKVGLVYTPVDFLTFRATYGTSYRAPALFEQFLGATAGFISSTNDICNDYTNSPNLNIVANCGSEGLPAGFTATSSVQVLQAGGAAAGLSAETSTNFTTGLILQPELPTGWGDFSFAVDYYEIEVSNGVDQVGTSFILSQCYGSATAEFAADNGYCALVSRNSATRALTVTNGYVNIASDLLTGVDYNLRYSVDVGPGSMLFNASATNYIRRESILFPTDPVYNSVGSLNDPEWSATASVSYSWDAWRVRYGVEWIDAMSDEELYAEQNGGVSLAANGIDASVDEYFLHGVSAQWSSDDLTVTAGVRNLFNERPPTATGYWVGGVGNSPLYSGYDFVGRSVFINLSKSF